MKKKFNETKVGQFLSKAAPGILDLAGDVLPDAGLFGLVKNLIKKDPVLPTEDKEKALMLLEQDMIEMKETTKRWESDMKSDSWLSKNTRPMCLIFLSPLLAYIAPMFGSREIFLAALLGIILVITAHRGHMFAAAMMASLGIFIQAIGMEPIKYSKRFTFDQSWLTGGLNLIVVVLGLFAISQAILLLVEKDKRSKAVKVTGGLFQGLKELGKHKRIATVSASFGVLMGMIPGVGEFTSQFLSYTYAQRTSKTPEKFGKGSTEGLVASEAANNAVSGPSLALLLTLGIPGGSIGIILGSVLIFYNIEFGQDSQQDSNALIYQLFFAGFIGIAIYGFIGFFGAKHLYRFVEAIPKNIFQILLALDSDMGDTLKFFASNYW